MPRLTSELLVRLIDGVTAPARAAAQAIRGIGRAQQEANGRAPLGQRLADASERAQSRVDALRGRMVDAAAAGYVLQRALAAPIRATMELESAMADIRKVVDFPTSGGLQQMQSDLLEMSRRIPVSVNGLAEIAAAAGAAGIELNDILAFTEGAAKIGTAFEISAGEAGDALAKLRTGLNLSNEEVFSLADAMNHLSDSQASSAADILDVVRRVGAQAKQFGFTAEQTSAFASAMLSAGADSEVAATSFRNLGLSLTRAESATSGQKEAMAALGLESTRLAKDMQEDAVKTTVDVLRRISRLPEWQQASISNQLFGSEARALGPLLTNIDLLTESLGLVQDKALYAGSAQREFEIRSKTTANAVQTFKNLLTELSITIGSALLPALNDIMTSLRPIIEGMISFAEANPVLTRNVIIATSAIVAFRVAMLGLQFATGIGAASVLSAASSFINFGGAARNGVGAAFAPFTRLGQHIKGVFQTVGLRFALMRKDMAAGALGIGGALRGGFATGARAILQLLNPMALVRGALFALRMAVIGTGVGAILVGIAAAGTWIYNNWSGITTMFEAFKGAFSRAIEPIRPALQPVVGLFRSISGAISRIIGLTGQVDPLGGKWADLGIKIGTNVGEAVVAVVQKVQELIGIFQNIGTTLTSALDGISWDSVFSALTNFMLNWPTQFAGIASQIAGYFTSFDWLGTGAAMMSALWSGISSGLSAIAERVQARLKSIFTFSGGGGTPAADIQYDAMGNPTGLQGRASGGPVNKGQSYWVGEEGVPEIFTPGADGFITPMDKMGAPQSSPRPAGGGGRRPAAGGAFTYAPVYHIQKVEGVADLEERLARHDRAAHEAYSSYLDGAFADG